MKKCGLLVCVIALAFLLAGCGPPAADTAKMNAALDATARMKSKVEAGTVYSDYSKAVGDTKGDVDLFTQSSAEESYPDVAQALTKAMAAYVYAGSVWNFKIQSGDRQVFTPTEAALSEHPEVGGLSADDAMQALWQTAGKNVDTARAAAK